MIIIIIKVFTASQIMWVPLVEKMKEENIFYYSINAGLKVMDLVLLLLFIVHSCLLISKA
jgi:hypothetical protein